jgi:hypothetical protein
MATMWSFTPGVAGDDVRVVMLRAWRACSGLCGSEVLAVPGRPLSQCLQTGRAVGLAERPVLHRQLDAHALRVEDLQRFPYPVMVDDADRAEPVRLEVITPFGQLLR